MIEHKRTDREAAIASAESVWDVEWHSEAHTYVIPPILWRLAAHHVRSVPDLGCGKTPDDLLPGAAPGV